MKKLYRSQEDRFAAGILGGAAEYFSIDPTILRLVFVFLVLVTGVFPLVILYIIGIYIIPESPAGIKGKSVVDEQ